MSGYYGEAIFDVTESKDQIREYLNDKCRSLSRYGYGLQRQIDWHNVVCEDRKEAETFIANMGSKERYAITAVQFIYDEPNTTEKYKALVEERNSVETELKKLKFVPKSEFITCKDCNAKMPVKYLYATNCPFCKSELRPTSFLKELDKLKKKLAKANEKVSNESKKVKKWLIQYTFPE